MITGADDRDTLAGEPVGRVRSTVQRMRGLARTDDEYDGVELFTALADYLDELTGPPGFQTLLPPADRQRLAATINRVRVEADAGSEPATRLDQPVNAAVTLVEGRALAGRLARSDDWASGLGVALLALYDYLDELHGGPGRFDVLLNSAERDRVATRWRS